MAPPGGDLLGLVFLRCLLDNLAGPIAAPDLCRAVVEAVAQASAARRRPPVTDRASNLPRLPVDGPTAFSHWTVVNADSRKLLPDPRLLYQFADAVVVPPFGP